METVVATKVHEFWGKVYQVADLLLAIKLHLTKPRIITLQREQYQD